MRMLTGAGRWDEHAITTRHGTASGQRRVTTTPSIGTIGPTTQEESAWTVRGWSEVGDQAGSTTTSVVTELEM